MRGRINLVFVPNYGVTMAQYLIPASDISQQISTAGYEASGTSNMKLMMNGALTVGTRDGATIEIAEEAGEDNVVLFGLTAEQVEDSRGWYDPWWHYHHEPETRAALDLIRANHFNPEEPGIFEPIWDALLTEGDYYMHLADLSAYAQAQARVGRLTVIAKPGPDGGGQHRSLGEILERSNDRRVRRRHLGRRAMPGSLGPTEE